MGNKAWLLFFLGAVLLSGCSASSSIDARKTGPAAKQMKNTAAAQLTDQDVFGNELTLEVSEEDIQDAIEKAQGKFEIPLHSSLILVQSGARVPDAVMQKEMQRYFRLSTFSGIPVARKKQPVQSGASVKMMDAESFSDGRNNLVNANYMQALRYIAAKGRQNAVIVYWGELECGKYNSDTKEMTWKKYSAENLAGLSLRYLIRFALVDVASGEWATYSPVNVESVSGKPDGNTDITEQQITSLKQKSYQMAVSDLVSRYSSNR